MHALWEGGRQSQQMLAPTHSTTQGKQVAHGGERGAASSGVGNPTRMGRTQRHIRGGRG